MPRVKGEIWVLRERVRSGQTLAPEEQARLREYFGRYRRLKQSLHLRPDRLEAWEAASGKAGMRLGPWIQQRVEISLQGPGEQLTRLQAELQAARDEITALRGVNGQYALENSQLNARLQRWEGKLFEAVDQALALRDGLPP